MADTKGLAKTSTRSLWKGAITFGLVHIPVGLHSATEETDVDFDWLDKRSMDPVGYKRINKRTGREIQKENVVKGVEYSKGEYVVLTPEEIEEAYPRTTQTMEIETFVDLQEIPFVYLERPYYTAPINKGDKVYALLREALRETGKAGLGRVVIHNKQHLALVVPYGPVLVLNLLRWGGEIRSWQDLPLPAEGKAKVKPNELKMATHLIAEMSGHWSADDFRDSFHDAIMKLVEKKAKAGEGEKVEPMEAAPEGDGAEVIDLTELLRRSLKGGKEVLESGSKARKAPARSRARTEERAVASGTPRKRSTAAKAPAKSRARRAA